MSFKSFLRSVVGPSPKRSRLPISPQAYLPTMTKSAPKQALPQTEPPVPRPVREKPAPKEKKPPLPQSASVALLKQLRAAATLTAQVAEQRSSLPILACVKMETSRMGATDLEMGISVAVPDLILSTPVCISNYKLQKVLRSLSEITSLEVQKHNLIINGEITMQGFDPAEFPLIEPETKLIPSESFPIPDRWAALLPAMAPEATRLHLYGVCLNLAQGEMVATDGHRLHLLEVPASPIYGKAVVPFQAARVVAKLVNQGPLSGQCYLAQVDIEDHKQWEEKQEGDEPSAIVTLVRFWNPTVQLWVRCADSEFPKYEDLWPKDDGLEVAFPVSHMREALNACIAIMPKAGMGVELIGRKEALTVRFVDPDGATVARDVSVTWKDDKGGMRWKKQGVLGINALYFNEFLAQCAGSSITMEVHEFTAPIVFEDGSLHAIIMPMRIIDGGPSRWPVKEEKPEELAEDRPPEPEAEQP